MLTVCVQLRTEAEMGSVLLYTVFLILCAFYLYDHVCASEQKLFNATACPLSQEAWEEEAEKYNCTGGIKYTCILNEKKSFVQGCLPAYPVPANQMKCPFLVSSTQHLTSSKYFTNCNVTWQGCPLGTHPEYTISELWKYPQCLIRETERGPGIFTTTQAPTAAQTTDQTTVHSSVTSITSPRSTSGKLSDESIAGIVVGIIAGIILAVVILFVVTWRRSGKGLGDFCRENGVTKTFCRRRSAEPRSFAYVRNDPAETHRLVPADMSVVEETRDEESGGVAGAELQNSSVIESSQGTEAEESANGF